MKRQWCPGIVAVILAVLTPQVVSSQHNASVVWRFKAEAVSENEVDLSITADLAGGWNIYSQYLKDGGPQPTRISFLQNDSYMPVGRSREAGKGATTYYDDIYEMEITRYSGTVVFHQKFKLNEPTAVIRGNIEYVTCNDHICIPGSRAFAVEATFLKPTH